MATSYDHQNSLAKGQQEMPVTVSYQKYNLELLEFLKWSFHAQELVDVTLTCEGQSLKAHKLIVSAGSIYLRRLIKRQIFQTDVHESLLPITEIIPCDLTKPKPQRNIGCFKTSLKKRRPLPHLKSIFGRNEAVAKYAIEDSQGNSSHVTKYSDGPPYDTIFLKEEPVIDEKPGENVKSDIPSWTVDGSGDSHLPNDGESSESDGADPDYKPISSIPAKMLCQPTPDIQADAESRQPKLAFHEPRPCSICGNMYRDAATLRTHTSIMHTAGEMLFQCTCKQNFTTKYHMQIHKHNGHK